MALLLVYMFMVFIFCLSQFCHFMFPCFITVHHLTTFWYSCFFGFTIPLYWAFCLFKKIFFSVLKTHHSECFHINNLFFWINPLGLNKDLHVIDPVKKSKLSKKREVGRERTGVREMMKESGDVFSPEKTAPCV